MKTVLVALLFLFFASRSFAGGFTVGNAGDGLVTATGDVYLSDLYLAGPTIYATPYFGDRVSPELVGANIIGDFDTWSLVARKIQDLNAALPGIGLLVADAIKSYQWRLVDNELEFTCDAQVPYIDIKKAKLKHVQLANRHFDQILINRSLWTRMSQTHRAALILHEAISSLLKPRSRVSCEASLNLTRTVLATLFSSDLLKYSVILKGTLNFNASQFRTLSYVNQRRMSQWNNNTDLIRVRVVNDRFPSWVQASKTLVARDKDSYQEATTDLCARLEKSVQAAASPVVWELEAYGRPYRFEIDTDGINVIFKDSFYLPTAQRWTDIQDCHAVLERVGEDFFFNFVEAKF